VVSNRDRSQLLRHALISIAVVLAIYGIFSNVATAQVPDNQPELGSGSEYDDLKPTLLLGARAEWAISLQQVGYSPMSPATSWPFFFNPRFEVSGGVRSDSGFVLGTVVVGPAFYTKSLAGVNPYPQFFQFLVDLGVKWGWVIERDRVDVLLGPRITFDLGFESGGVSPYGTFGATFGFMPKAEGKRARFIMMLEPGIVIYSGFAFFSLAVTAGAAL